MSRGYRSIIIAAVLGLVLISFGLGSYVTALHQPKEERYQGYRYATDKPVEIEPAPPGRANSKTFEYRAPCRDPKGRDESDLCAQWRAAKAAENSALWAKWGFWIGVIGSALLLWQIVLTRKAVEDTGEATNAMRESNEILRATEDARIVVSIHETKFEPMTGFTFTIAITNIGRSAAVIHSICIDGDIVIIEQAVIGGATETFEDACFMLWEHKAPCLECLSGEKPEEVMMIVEQTTPLRGRLQIEIPCHFWLFRDGWKARANYEDRSEKPV